jgi:hypothetical protein
MRTSSWNFGSEACQHLQTLRGTEFCVHLKIALRLRTFMLTDFSLSAAWFSPITEQ